MNLSKEIEAAKKRITFRIAYATLKQFRVNPSLSDTIAEEKRILLKIK